MYRACEVTGVRQFRLVERETRDPGFQEVRVRVSTCGVCHSDAVAVDGMRSDPSRPIVPGHEFVGVIDAVGDAVTTWKVGQRVGVGFLGGHCGVCPWCRRGDFVNCTDQPRTGTTIDGGYAEVAYARASGLVAVPDELSDVAASPLLCAGLTVYNALLKTGARNGSLVAVQGIGGLGHLGVQYARRLGYRVVAIARGTEKAALAAELGAEHYIDSTAADPGAALRQLGGAAAVIATASVGSSMSPLISGLAPRGEMIVVGATRDPVSLPTSQLIFGERTVGGSLTGSSIENEDAMDFAARTGVRPMVETRPLSEAAEAYERMMSGKARFRVVLDMSA